MAGETFLQVLQICKGKAPGREKDEGQAILCLASFCVFFAVFSSGPSWAKLGQDPAQATGVFQCQWRSSSDAQSEEGDYSK